MTPTEILSLRPGPAMDGLVDDALGVDRTASTAGRRYEALSGYAWQANERLPDGTEVDVYDFGGGQVFRIERPGWTVESDSPSGECWPWRTREGKPWQSAMEAFVAAWRAPASRPWSTDHGAAIEAMHTFCEDRKLELIIARDQLSSGWSYIVETNHGRTDSGDVPGLPGLALCVARAILLAAERTVAT